VPKTSKNKALTASVMGLNPCSMVAKRESHCRHGEAILACDHRW
jgi:hypothetical protein